jgi:hypothetical protein
MKAPNPILHEIAGFIDTPFFRLSKTRFVIFLSVSRLFCPMGGFFRLFLWREITIKARAFF